MWSCMFALIGAVVALSGFVNPASAHEQMAHMEEMVFVESRFPYAETVKRLKAAIRAQGMPVMFVDDQQATLRKAGVKTPGAMVIEFFNTKYTKRIFEIDHAAHMAIPLRIGVMEGSEHDPHSQATHVMYDKPSAVFARYQGLEAVAGELDRVLEAIVAAVAAKGGMKMEGHGQEGKSERRPRH